MKSVCDFADERKTSEYQRYASYISVRAFATFCERYLGDLL